MANQSELDEQRKRLEGKSRADLLHEKHRASPNVASCIVATQLLDEMDQKEAGKMLRWAKIAGWSALVAALFGGIAVVPIVRDWCASSSHATPAQIAAPHSAPLLMSPQALVVSSNLPPISSNQPALKP